MRTLDFLGLDESKVKGVVGGLSQLLADFQVYYTNLRGFHWNVRGKSFFVMHAKYEELYNDAAEKIDELAERILQLGAVPSGSRLPWSVGVRLARPCWDGSRCLLPRSARY